MNTSLRQIRKQLQYSLKQFEWKSENSTLRDTCSIGNLNITRSVIDDIDRIGLFSNLTDFLKKSAIYTTANDKMTIQYEEGRLIIQSLDTLKTLCYELFVTLAKTVPPENVNSINIKLPPISDFDELSKVSRDIHIGLTQVIFSEDIKGQTKIESVENGSIWINVFVGATAIPVIASLVWASAVIYKKIQEGKLLAEQVRGLKVKNESLEDILKAQKAETELMIQAEAEHIQSEYFKNTTPENIERIKNSISTFAELIGRGAEIQPALVAPENVTNLFPDPTNLIGLESKIKKIGPANN